MRSYRLSRLSLRAAGAALATVALALVGGPAGAQPAGDAAAADLPVRFAT
jgi:hypothetical protein